MSRFLQKMTAMSKKPSDYALEPTPITQTGIPDVGNGIPNHGGPKVAFGTPEVGTPEATEGVPKVAIPEAGIPTTATVQRRVIIRRETKAQDGHTSGENAVYETLWKLAQRGDKRTVTIGYTDLSRACSLSLNTVKACLQKLQDKLAIHRVTKATQQGTTYLVYSYSDILSRRREAGLTHYIKMNGGVVFVDPATGTPIVGAPQSTSGIPNLATVGIPNLATSGVPNLGDGPYRHLVETKEDTFLAHLDRIGRSDAVGVERERLMDEWLSGKG